MKFDILKKYGLLGKNINYSFSRGYFKEKFEKLGFTNHEYVNFDIETIDLLPAVFLENKTVLQGMNVTIPYKEEVIPYLDSLSKKAKKIGAVNTIKFLPDGTTKGYNTDYYGFMKSLEPLLNHHHKQALILGTGGASKGVAFALEELNIAYKFVSRTAKENVFSYEDLNEKTFSEYQIIINSTPIGTSPNVEQCPKIPYDFFTKNHIAFDLIYNPEETTFLAKAKLKGAQTKNGLSMLVYQAEKSWEIWNK
jgi:shikimate dehydrogenase